MARPNHRRTRSAMSTRQILPVQPVRQAAVIEPKGHLDRFFGLTAHGTTVNRELVAGLTTFLTMAYIIFVNPAILSDAGMDNGAVFVATCLASAFSCFAMGLYANFPIALAPGMGLNAYFTYGVVLGMGYDWHVALGAVFISSIISVVFSVLPVREAIINAVPRSLKLGIAAGIGLFLGVLGLKNAGLIVASPETLVTLGNLSHAEPVLALGGFILAAALSAWRVPGALIIAILGVTAIGVMSGVSSFHGIAALPPSLSPTFLQFDLAGALDAGFLTIVFVFVLVDLFDTGGTMIAVAQRAGLAKRGQDLPDLHRAMVADSAGSAVGSMLGTSTITCYIESVAGIEAGGRTGLTAVTVGLLLLASLLFSPLAQTIPGYAAAPALLFVACLMARSLGELDWDDITEYAPGVLTALAMPLSFSIANGIALGFITYAAIKLLTGRVRELPVLIGIIALLFCAKFYWIGST